VAKKNTKLNGFVDQIIALFSSVFIKQVKKVGVMMQNTVDILSSIHVRDGQLSFGNVA
jgi:hypothetical protein